jgi:hypothetical protein
VLYCIYLFIVSIYYLFLYLFIYVCISSYYNHSPDFSLLETNIYYGARNPGSTNVLFVNGDVDPWHSLSVLNSTAVNQAILIDGTFAYHIAFFSALSLPCCFVSDFIGTAHCADMRPYTSFDPPALLTAQEQIRKILANWLKQAGRQPRSQARRH